MARAAATTVVSTALRLRAQLDPELRWPVCPFAVARRLRVQVRFMEVPSLEGLYTPGPPPTIVIGAERPWGRRNFTAAHEIGHHVFGHGDRIDEDEDDARQVLRPHEEWVADRFASALLMPKLCVSAAFSCRNLSPSMSTPADFYLVSKELGVGYTTLITHMERVLQLIPADTADELRRQRPARIRAAILGTDPARDLVVADEHWRRDTVDLEVGDLLLLPNGGGIQSAYLGELEANRLFEAVAPGQGVLALPGRTSSVPVRVARQKFEGLDRWRFLEGADDD